MSFKAKEIEITKISKFQLGAGEELLMNASGSRSEILELARFVSDKINGEGKKCWEDNFITITMRFFGKFKTNRSKVNYWYNFPQKK